MDVDLIPTTNAFQVQTNGNAVKNKMTMVVFSGDMDKVMAGLIIATGAAASGMEVAMFYTFWGLKAIQTGKTKPGKGWMGKMLGMMNRGGLDNLGPSRFNMGGMGRWMFKKMMNEKGVTTLPELYEAAVDMGVKMTPCQMSMDVMEYSPEDFQPNVTPPAGVASMLEDAGESKFVLFI
jgi:peroxiredoxin family protein